MPGASPCCCERRRDDIEGLRRTRTAPPRSRSPDRLAATPGLDCREAAAKGPPPPASRPRLISSRAARTASSTVEVFTFALYFACNVLRRSRCGRASVSIARRSSGDAAACFVATSDTNSMRLPIGAFACARAARAMSSRCRESIDSEKCGATISHTAAGRDSYGTSRPLRTSRRVAASQKAPNVRATNSSRDFETLSGSTSAARPREASAVSRIQPGGWARSDTPTSIGSRRLRIQGVSGKCLGDDVAVERVPAAQLQHVRLARMACEGGAQRSKGG